MTTLLVGFDSAWSPTNCGALLGLLRFDVRCDLIPLSRSDWVRKFGCYKPSVNSPARLQ